MMRTVRALGAMTVALAAVGASMPASAATGVGTYYAMPSWAQTLPADSRFVVLSNFGNAAVLDRETGLVWQRQIAANNSWQNSISACLWTPASAYYRGGWRLPKAHELSSLLSGLSNNGNPFAFPSQGFIWSASEFDSDRAYVWDSVENRGSTRLKSDSGGVLCVRGSE